MRWARPAASLSMVLVAASLAAQSVVVAPPLPPPPPPTKAMPEIPAATPDADFPLRVYLLVARVGGIAERYHGYGSGNLLDAKGPQGFDYGFECEVPFAAN